MRPSPPSSRCSNLNANPNLLARMHPSDAILAADLRRSAYKAWAPQARQSGRPAIHHLSRSPIALGRSLKGHEDQFRPPGRDGRYRLDEATFAVSRGNGRAAPIPAGGGTTLEPLKSTQSGHCAYGQINRFGPMAISAKSVSVLVRRISSRRCPRAIGAEGRRLDGPNPTPH